MSKIKYRYNPDTLSYEMITTSAKKKIIKLGIMFVASIFIAMVYYLIYSHFYDTPKERAMINKLSTIKFSYQMLSKDLEHIDRILADIQKRDDDVYRTILESDPIPASIRQAGFGGVNRYEPLEGYINSNLMIAATKHTEKISKQLVVQSKSYDELIYKAINKEQMALTRPAIMPISNKDLKRPSSYGWRSDPFTGERRFHDGMDFAADVGANIYASGDGTVIKTEYNGGGYGRMIIIDHGFGIQTRYAHMLGFKVLENAEVKRGQIIGTVGNTGRSKGPHLHYEILVNGRTVNPINYFSNDFSPDEYVRLQAESQENDILETW